MDSFWQVILLPESYAFLVSIQLVIILFIIELVDYVFTGGVLGTALDNLIDFDVGADLDADIDVDADMDADADVDPDFDADIKTSWLNRFLSWMYVGDVPIMILSVILLTNFGLFGWFLQYGVYITSGSALPRLLAVLISLVASVIGTHYAAMPIAHFIPSHESYAVEKENLIGKPAEITQGTATSDLSARAVVSISDERINVRVVPADEKESYPSGTRVELKERVSEDNDLFKVVAVE